MIGLQGAPSGVTRISFQGEGEMHGLPPDFYKFFKFFNQKFHQNSPLEDLSMREIDFPHCRILKTLP
jgi:hypothetical protein